MTAISQSNITRRWEPRVVTGDAHAQELPILMSNLHPPTLPHALVSRERLCSRITQAVDERAVTLVSAPAGTGKTVLAACWYRHHSQRRPVAWLTATEHIDTPPRFWRHVVAALQQAGVAVDRAEREAPSSEAPSSEAPSSEAAMPFLVRLAADLLDAPGPVALVLDELHTLSTPSVLDGVDFLIRHASPKLRLMLCTRHVPHLPIQRYRLGDSITQLGMTDLAFTPDESRQLITMAGVDLPADTAAALSERIDGWATGVRLTALSLHNSIEPARAHRSGIDEAVEPARVEIDTDEAIAGYLRREVIAALPDGDRRALLRLGVADHLWPDLVETLTGARNGRRLLADLERRGCFVENSALVPGGHRLHSAMRRVLRADLEEEAPDDAAALHLACARWLASTDRRVAAARHAAAAHDWDFFCDLLIEDMQVPALIDRHRVDEVSRTLLLDTLPAEACSAAASVLRAAVAVGRGAPAQATEQLQRASAGNPRRREPLELTLSANLVRQAVGVAVTGRVDVSVSELTRRMLQQLPPARRSAHPMLTALVAMYHGIGVAGSGTSDETLTALGDAVATWTAVPDASRGSGELALDCLGLLAAAQVTSGNLRTGTALAHRARRLAEHFGAAGRDGVLAADVATAWASAQRGDYAAAQTWATRARHRVDNDPGAIVMPLLAAVQARIRRARGQLPQALGLLDSIDTSRSPSWIRQCLSADTRNVRLTSRCTAAAVDTLPLEAADRSEPSELDGPVRPPMAHLFERLTARETDVLRFLAQLYSTQEIAAAMYVSPNTVRTHVRGILRKLDVPRRNMAVRRARELQLI